MLKRPRRQHMMAQIEMVPESGCWIWMGMVQRGYGRTSKKFYGAVTAHRAFYQEFVGPISDGLEVCHTCDVRPCVNPDHLYVGTRRDNCRDAVVRKRYKNLQKTHCNEGHELSGYNLMIIWNHRDGKHQRNCRTCRNVKRQQKRKAARDLKAAGLAKATGEVRDGGEVVVAVP